MTLYDTSTNYNSADQGIVQVGDTAFEVKLPLGKDCREWLLEECDWDFDEVVDADLYEFLTIYSEYQSMEEIPEQEYNSETKSWPAPSQQHYYSRLLELTSAGKYKIKYVFKEVMGAVEFKLRWVGSYNRIG